jgi:hypothetical protein
LNLQSFLTAASAVAQAGTVIPEVISVFTAAAQAFSAPTDQETALAAIHDMAAQNDAGHARLQEKLKAAASR